MINVNDPYGKKIRIQFSDTPSTKYTLKPYTRLFVYPDSQGTFEVDTIEQPIVADAIHVIPPGFLHFHNHQPYICLELAHQRFHDFFNYLLYYVMYCSPQALAPLEKDLYRFGFFKMLIEQNVPAEEFAHHVKACITQRIDIKPYQIGSGLLKKMQQGERLLDLISLNNNTTAKRIFIKDIQDYLSVDERNLQRICKRVFNTAPKIILDHQILSVVFIRILTTNDSFADISSSLGFSNASNFSNFIKRMTKMTPSGLRDKLMSRGLERE